MIITAFPEQPVMDNFVNVELVQERIAVLLPSGEALWH